MNRSRIGIVEGAQTPNDDHNMSFLKGADRNDIVDIEIFQMQGAR